MVNHTEVDSRGILVWRTYTQGAVPWPQRSGLGLAVSRFPPSEKLSREDGAVKLEGIRVGRPLAGQVSVSDDDAPRSVFC